jgi:hypothetical protein
MAWRWVRTHADMRHSESASRHPRLRCVQPESGLWNAPASKYLRRIRCDTVGHVRVCACARVCVCVCVCVCVEREAEITTRQGGTLSNRQVFNGLSILVGNANSSMPVRRMRTRARARAHAHTHTQPTRQSRTRQSHKKAVCGVLSGHLPARTRSSPPCRTTAAWGPGRRSPRSARPRGSG